ncbi:sensor histidine kinase [Puia dinghuensis]|uniref:sensor histidine kinase n=1 Tax=Puia dinghuensis TaxID=1792502 RepID=UPI0016636C8E|nr:histidine kinase [Puia dinghuensis]
MNKKIVLNDRVVKSIGIPALGLFIPNLSGLINNRLYTYSELAACYLFFIVVAFLVWEGNVRLMYFIRERFPWSKKSYYKIIVALFFANIVYSGAISLLLLRLWQYCSRETQGDNQHLINTVLIIIIAACFITNIYEILFLNLEKEYNESRVEQLNVAKAQAELEALKNQIDPHFIFNSLNTLSFLITRDPKNARLYNDTLARVYRYILSNKERDLVLLREEVEFISNYFYLLKIRFADAISMSIEITDLSAENFLIPPISLQALVENAIKHNEFSEKKPLAIDVSISADYVIVRNVMNRRSNPQPTSKIGLSNLDNRYKLITKRNIQVENNFESFVVKLPIVRF